MKRNQIDKRLSRIEELVTLLVDAKFPPDPHPLGYPGCDCSPTCGASAGQEQTVKVFIDGTPEDYSYNVERAEEATDQSEYLYSVDEMLRIFDTARAIGQIEGKAELAAEVLFEQVENIMGKKKQGE